MSSSHILYIKQKKLYVYTGTSGILNVAMLNKSMYRSPSPATFVHIVNSLRADALSFLPHSAGKLAMTMYTMEVRTEMTLGSAGFGASICDCVSRRTRSISVS